MERWARANYQPFLPMGENGTRVTASKEHIALSLEAAKEGMVLLKNEGNALPLAKGSRIALFGKGTFDYVKGGGGSGDVTVSYTRNLYEGFQELGDQVNIQEELAEFYRQEVQKQYKEGKAPGMTVEPECPEELIRKAKAFTDTAVISICRFSGEGWDRSNSDFYLTKEEEALVESVTANFAKVIVVLNVGGMVDTEWFHDNPKIQAVLLAWQGGIEGGLAAAELLCGLSNPSGKLTDTFAKQLEDYPSTADFGISEDYVDYTEDIYVGYRYFETIPGATKKVNYPFGFGLSYTTFEVTEIETKVVQRELTSSAGDGEEVQMTVDVCNTGLAAGKEVVQAYYSAPQGKLGKPAKVLGAFAKTRLLAPGETQRMTLHFPVAQMSSYDDLGKVQKSAYVLEEGAYHFYIGTNVRDARESVFVFHLKETRITEQLSEKIAPKQLKNRMLSDGSFEDLPQREVTDPRATLLAPWDGKAHDGLSPVEVHREGRVVWAKPEKKQFLQVADGEISMEEFLAQFSDAELAGLLGGQPNRGVANTFGYGNLPQYGVPNIMTADGPAGLRIEQKCGVCTTAWPCATMLACTWNPALVERVGAAGGAEVKENNIGAWLTPAINIHRSPLCGRNFEYYSEDPLVAGKMAGAMVRGIQSNHIAATVKHFALNNKEVNRKESDSRVSERAAREIYLKAFEMIVKEDAPWSIMSSYNLINGCRASESRELLEDILRSEWGFEGMVTSDWWTNGEHYKETLAGNDVKMGCGFPERLLAAKEKGILSREQMELCAKRILELILKVD